MALKRTIHELCGRCGQKQAEMDEYGQIRVNGHSCVPGPPAVPYRTDLSKAVFVRADGTHVVMCDGQGRATVVM